MQFILLFPLSKRVRLNLNKLCSHIRHSLKVQLIQAISTSDNEKKTAKIQGSKEEESKRRRKKQETIYPSNSEKKCPCSSCSARSSGPSSCRACACVWTVWGTRNNMSTIRRAYMELSNGIRGLRLHRDQTTPAASTASSSTKDTSTITTPIPSTIKSAAAASTLPSTTGVGGKILRLSKTNQSGNNNVVNAPSATTSSTISSLAAKRMRIMNGRYCPTSIQELFLDEKFLSRFFAYFSPEEKGDLARVCKRWKNILYNVCYWTDVIPVISCRKWCNDVEGRNKFFESLILRGFDSICLFGATDEDIQDFVNNFPPCRKQIRSVSVRCSNVTDVGLELMFKKMTCVYRLELSGCNEITETGLWSCLNPKIVSLSVSDCINVADDTVGAIAQLLPALYELNLQAYHVTDAALSFFSAKQSYTLCILRLQSCWEITNHGIVNIVHSLPNLTVLSLSGCSKITDDGVELIAENLRKLRLLDLSWCPKITDASLEYIACDLSQLQELVLDRCTHITDIGVGYLSTMTSLIKLYLRWCTQVRDYGLQHLYSMRNLRVLSLAGCSQVTSHGLCGLVNLRNLEELELTNCNSAAVDLCQYLRDNIPGCLVLE